MPFADSVTHVIFDLDGVLLDTERLYTQATQQVVAEFGKTFDWSLKARMMGRAELESAEDLVRWLKLPISGAEYLARKRPLLERLFDDTQALPGAEAFVRTLHARGLGLAVATSSSTEYFRRKTAPHAWFSLFSVVICADHPELERLKPAPDIFLLAARELGAEPGVCAVVEDSLAGVQAARAAGMYVVALPDLALDAAAFSAAHRVVRSYAELTPRSAS
jgi:pseudouridine 5'-phosphatase